MTRVLLTGGTGFVGRQILRQVLARGCAVRAVVRGGSLPPPCRACAPPRTAPGSTR